jgi:hypothetical protein
MRGAKHMRNMGERRNLYKVLIRKSKVKKLNGNQSIDGMVVLK